MPILTDKYLNYDPKLPSVLYHYCSVNTLISIIENHNIWLSDAEKTNDYTEMKWLFSKFQEVIDEDVLSYQTIYDNELLKIVKETACNAVENLLSKQALISKNSKSFLICFSEARDLLSQWRAYGDDGKGVAIGFNTEVLKIFMQDPFYKLTKVIYKSEDILRFLHMAIDDPLKWAIDGCIDREGRSYDKENLKYNILTLMLSIWQESFVYKNDKFYEEQEWRIFRKLQSDNYSSDDGVDDYGYADFIDGFFKDNNDVRGGFTRSAMKFRGVGDDMRVYFELGFEKQKKDIIKEIIIGSKCQIDDLDLRLLLAKNGYIEDVFSESISVTKSECPYI